VLGSGDRQTPVGKEHLQEDQRSVMELSRREEARAGRLAASLSSQTSFPNGRLLTISDHLPASAHHTDTH
jgi:hypothetical protein